jgi:hypothetical protein
VEELSLVPAVRELISESFGGRGVPVCFADPGITFSSGYCTTGHICLRNNLSVVVAITTLIFEMCNATHIYHFPSVFECTSADEFALEMEVEEYDTSVMFTRVLERVAASEGVLELLSEDEYGR